MPQVKNLKSNSFRIKNAEFFIFEFLYTTAMKTLKSNFFLFTSNQTFSIYLQLKKFVFMCTIIYFLKVFSNLNKEEQVILIKHRFFVLNKIIVC